MKRIFVLLVSLLLLASLAAPQQSTADGTTADWQPAAGPTGGSVATLALSPNYAVDHTVFAGLRGQGIYRTLSSGDSWIRVSPDGWVVVDVALSPAYASDETVFATTGFHPTGYRVYRSTDAGGTWTDVTPTWSGPPSVPPHVVVSTDYATDGSVYVIAGSQSFVSTDGGDTFTATGGWLASHTVIGLAFSPAYATDRTLFALDRDEGLFTSTDGGATWTATALTGAHTTFAVSPNYAADATLLAVRRSDGRLRRSTDGGTSWSDLSVTLDPAGTHTLRFSPTFADDGLVLAASSADAGVYRSADGGDTWELRGIYDPANPFLGGFVGGGPFDVVVAGSDASDARAFAGTSSGLYMSYNRGESWFRPEENLAPLTVRTVAAAPGAADTLIAGTSFFENVRFDSGALIESDGNLHLSTDGGTSWRAVTGRLQQIHNVAFSPDFANDETVFATAGTLGQHGFFDGGVYRSNDGGLNWEEVFGDRPADALAVSPQFASDGTVWAALLTSLAEFGIYRSTDGGDTWTHTAPVNAHSLVVSPHYAVDGTLFAGTPNGLRKSTDGGTSWSSVGPAGAVTALTISPVYGASQTLYAAVQDVSAGAPGTLHRSTDGGATWQLVDTGAPATIDGTARTVTALRFARDGSMLAGLSYGDLESAVYRSTDGGATWTQVDGTFKGRALYTLETVPDRSMTFYAGTDGQLWQAHVSQGGPEEPGTWSTNGPRGGRVKALALSPTFGSDGVVFAGDWIMGRGSTETGSGIVKSTDGGRTWMPSAAGTEDVDYASAVHDYAVSPAFGSDGTVFAATWGGLFKSVDGGATWDWRSTLYSGPPGSITSVAVASDYADSGHVLAGSIWGTLFRSDDGGSTWTKIPHTLSVADVTYSPNFVNDDTAFVAAADGLYTSTDRGVNWTNVFSQSLQTLVTSPNYADDDTLFAGNGDGFFTSNDGGTTWISTTLSMEYPGATAIAVSPTFQDDALVFAGNAGGLYRSSDGGTTWSAVDTFPDVPVYTLAISPAWPVQNTILAGTAEGVYRSTDGGGSWVRSEGLRGLRSHPLTFSANRDLLLTGAPDHGLYASTDKGDTWSPAGFQDGSWQYAITDAAISPAFLSDRTLFAAWRSGVSIGGSIYRSTDGGSTWENVYNTDYVASLAVSPAFDEDGTVYAAGSSGRVLSSTDRGTTWNPVGTFPDFSKGITQVAVPPTYASDGTVFAGGNGFWRLPAGASEWEPAASGLTEDRFVRSIAVSPNYATDGTLLSAASWSVGTGGPSVFGVYRSTDGGLNWEPVNTGLPVDTELRSLAFSPTFAADRTAYVVSETTLYRSIDGGQRWTAVGAPPDAAMLHDLVVDSTRTVYVSTDTGVWTYSTPTIDIVVNGGFEVDSGWSMPSTAWTAGYSTAVAFDGARSSRVGITDGSNVTSYSSVRQTIAIPDDAERATLRFHLYPVSSEGTPAIRSELLQEVGGITTLSDSAAAGGDAQYVLVIDSNTSAILEALHWGLSNDQAWHPQTADLSGYAGRSIVVHFGVYNDGTGGRTGMFIDNVSLLTASSVFRGYVPLIVRE